jgi:hypothetical protein
MYTRLYHMYADYVERMDTYDLPHLDYHQWLEQELLNRLEPETDTGPGEGQPPLFDDGEFEDHDRYG